MNRDQETKSPEVVTALMIQYLRHVDEYHSDEGFSALPGAELQHLRRAALDARMVAPAGDGLGVAEQGRFVLNL
jgi:hypothetical protein